jgi:uncharacterized membrane protein
MRKMAMQGSMGTDVGLEQEGASDIEAGEGIGGSVAQTVGQSIGQSFGQNVGQYERVASGIGGAALVWLGLQSRSLGGILAALGGAALLHRGITGRCQVYRRIGVDTTSEGLSRGVEVDRAITIGRSSDEVYRFWRSFENLPRFVQHLSSMTEREDGRWHCVSNVAGRDLHWETQLIEDVPGERIVWRTVPGSRVEADGEVTFRPAPGNRGTEVRVRIRVAPPGGALAMALGPFLRHFSRAQIGQDLHRLKQILETGEVTTGAMRAEELSERDELSGGRRISREDEAAGAAVMGRKAGMRGQSSGRNGHGAQP